MQLKTTLLPALLAVAAVAAPAAPRHDLNTTAGVMVEGGPLALRGYDPVAYFTHGKAIPGSFRHASLHDGAVYQFASPENKKAFEANPAKYVPAYGGYCAYGVSVGKKFDGDPRVWKVVDGRLYLNLNADIQEMWMKDVPGAVSKADRNWTKIRDAAPAGL